MATLKLEGFPGRSDDVRPASVDAQLWPATIFPEGAGYPGAPKAGDKATLANVPPARPHPGSGRPGEAFGQAPPIPARAGLRRGR